MGIELSVQVQLTHTQISGELRMNRGKKKEKQSKSVYSEITPMDSYLLCLYLKYKKKKKKQNLHIIHLCQLRDTVALLTHMEIWSQNNTGINSRKTIPEVHQQGCTQSSLWQIFMLSKHEKKQMWTVILQKSSMLASREFTRFLSAVIHTLLFTESTPSSLVFLLWLTRQCVTVVSAARKGLTYVPASLLIKWIICENNFTF